MSNLIERVERVIYDAIGGEGVLEDDGTIRRLDYANAALMNRTARKLAAAAIAEVRRFDAEHGPSEAEVEMAAIAGNGRFVSALDSEGIPRDQFYLYGDDPKEDQEIRDIQQAGLHAAAVERARAAGVE